MNQEKGSNKSQNRIQNKSNRLIHEKSPYLLQHAYNPVDWYSWGREAFERAKKENKPIFLSIGYSTCHWCHVMAHESFEDEEVAELLNKYFICIKVDREERPDIDKIYMDVCQLMTGTGGWPLTIIMTPDKKPFFAGTYFPKKTKYRRVGLLELLNRIVLIWNDQHEKIVETAESVIKILKSYDKPSKDNIINESILHRAFNSLFNSFDEKYGGFGSAPKFPTPHILYFLLRYWRRYNNNYALYMVEKTLNSMRQGGIWDHLGYGFHRYSTDREWIVPHFEKMLYDQALIAIAYIEAFQITKNPEYEKTVREIFNYVNRELKSSEGGFYSAEDADSEGVEGKYYLWTYDELKSILSDSDLNFIKKIYNIKESGNYFDKVSEGKKGLNILYLKNPLPKLAENLNLNFGELTEKLEEIRKRLFNEREKRIKPNKDDKILTDWNALIIAALAKAAKVFDNNEFLSLAEKGASFIFNNLMTPDGHLLHRFKDGDAAIDGTLIDYSFLIWALIELYESSFNSKYLEYALNLNDILLEEFWDEKNGGFYFTLENDDLIVRQKDLYDGAIPSGNSIAMLNLLKLSKVTMNEELELKAKQIPNISSSNINKSPIGFTQLLNAIDFALGPINEIVISSKNNTLELQKFLKLIRGKFLPNKIILFNPTDEESPLIQKFAPFIKYQKSIDEKPTVYICSNYTCKAPITNLNELEKAL